MSDPRLDHRLNQPCPDCGCAQWLHTDRCLTVKQGDSKRSGFVPCGCAHTAREFATV